jgi:hypothetical protein
LSAARAGNAMATHRSRARSRGEAGAAAGANAVAVMPLVLRRDWPFRGCRAFPAR